ncbi:hypothetical protein ACFVTE_09675 [Arthrobacter sp. NPDC058097]|uniref:hypothetical protein n=1 Tax=Arthrobacter sp. NPDC058097 TaxID=3346340 RepID=UPI0036D7EA4F
MWHHIRRLSSREYSVLVVLDLADWGWVCFQPSRARGPVEEEARSGLLGARD